jgi:hypothetical protein
MALPESHRKFLQSYLQVHEQLLETLREQQEHIASEIRIHELVLSLGRDDQLLEILGAIADDSEAADSACENARSHFSARGVTLPEDLDISARRNEGEVVVHGVYPHDPHPFELRWDRKGGFSALPLEPSSKVTT